MPAVEDSVSWHDAIQRKRSLCQENAVLLVVQQLGITLNGGPGGPCCQIKNMNYPRAVELHRRAGQQAVLV